MNGKRRRIEKKEMNDKRGDPEGIDRYNKEERTD